MFELLCVLTGAVLCAGAVIGYTRSRDAFHPSVVLAPLFAYMFSLWPLLLNSTGGLEDLFDVDGLVHVQLIYLITVVFFVAGLLWIPADLRSGASMATWRRALVPTAETYHRLYILGIVLGVAAVLAYADTIRNVGGLVSAYSRHKGGGVASSGYIGEAIQLALPAILLIAVSRGALGRLRFADIMLVMLFSAPHLIHGTLGGRRGPLFLILAVLVFSWFVVRGVRPSLSKITAAISACGAAVIVVWSQRSKNYLGSVEGFSWDNLVAIFTPETVSWGNTYAFSVTSILTTEHFDKFYWGYRYFVTFFIRPIPRQLWPTKYHDVGADWILGIGDDQRFIDYFQATGVGSLAGAAIPSIADGYLEFAWGVVPMFLVLGLVFSIVWQRHRRFGAVWTVVFFVMLVLGIYLATQSFSAWAIRLMVVGVPTIVLWRFWVSPTLAQPDDLQGPPDDAAAIDLYDHRPAQ